MWQILGRGGLFAPPPYPWAAPKKPILNRVKVKLIATPVTTVCGDQQSKFLRLLKSLNPDFMHTYFKKDLHSARRKNDLVITHVSERSQSDLHWERHLRDLTETSLKKLLFCDVFKTSQKHLKKDVFCVTSLTRLEHISIKMSIPWRLWDVSKISLASICDFSKSSHKMD